MSLHHFLVIVCSAALALGGAMPAVAQQASISVDAESNAAMTAVTSAEAPEPVGATPDASADSGLAQQAPAPAVSAPGAGTWLPGPAASGDRNTIGGAIDLPAAGASIAPGALQVGGWFVDMTAQGWAGADDVEIVSGTIDAGGRPLGHAQFGQSRPDVGTALKNGFWEQSGWSANISTAALAPGATTLSVYVHTPSRGWWIHQVNITVRAPAPPQRATPASTSIYGNDMSYPQCPTGAEPPAPAFAIVGVTGGLPFTSNPCLAREYFWALGSTSANQAHVGLYMNSANPGPTESSNWPGAGAGSPRACDGSWSADCAYDYGWSAAHDAYGRALGVVGGTAAAQYTWWLDVEALNSWSDDTASNAADLQGSIDFLRSVGVASIGVYSTSTDWGTLIGAATSGAGPFSGLLNWRPGPNSAQEAPAWCDRSVTGGRVKFVQFPSNGFDADFACY